eukprot:8816911-Karenia_brevis.AAC.1
MKLTSVLLALPMFTEIATDMSQERHSARHVGMDGATCRSPRFTDVRDGSRAPEKPNGVRENVGTDVGKSRFKGRTNIWEGPDVGNDVI